jgi:hypothetical protein
MSWIKALDLTRAGEYDACMPAYYSKPRARSFTFSDSFAESPVVLAAKREYWTRSRQNMA